MCRLFGFRSVLRSGMHRSLMTADNALAVQSKAHPDGWGVAYYVDGVPHVVRSTASAEQDALFARVSGVVSSNTVVGHVRQATQGSLSPLNCHPFQHGRWTFAHNGDVPGFAGRKRALLERVMPHYRDHLLGDTDSEVLFLLFLTHLQARTSDEAVQIDHVVEALRATAADACAVVDEVRGEGLPDVSPGAKQGEGPLLNMLVTDGVLMAAYKSGKPLYLSTHKTRCPERESCRWFASACEAPATHGTTVQHCIVSSEPLHGENVWHALTDGDVVGVDDRMQLVWQDATGGTLNHAD